MKLKVYKPSTRSSLTHSTSHNRTFSIKTNVNAKKNPDMLLTFIKEHSLQNFKNQKQILKHTFSSPLWKSTINNPECSENKFIELLNMIFDSRNMNVFDKMELIQLALSPSFIKSHFYQTVAMREKIFSKINRYICSCKQPVLQKTVWIQMMNLAKKNSKNPIETLNFTLQNMLTSTLGQNQSEAVIQKNIKELLSLPLLTSEDCDSESKKKMSLVLITTIFKSKKPSIHKLSLINIILKSPCFKEKSATKNLFNIVVIHLKDCNDKNLQISALQAFKHSPLYAPMIKNMEHYKRLTTILKEDPSKGSKKFGSKVTKIFQLYTKCEQAIILECINKHKENLELDHSPETLMQFLPEVKSLNLDKEIDKLNKKIKFITIEALKDIQDSLFDISKEIQKNYPKINIEKIHVETFKRIMGGKWGGFIGDLIIDNVPTAICDTLLAEILINSLTTKKQLASFKCIEELSTYLEKQGAPEIYRITWENASLDVLNDYSYNLEESNMLADLRRSRNNGELLFSKDEVDELSEIINDTTKLQNLKLPSGIDNEAENPSFDSYIDKLITELLKEKYYNDEVTQYLSDSLQNKKNPQENHFSNNDILELASIIKDTQKLTQKKDGFEEML